MQNTENFNINYYIINTKVIILHEWFEPIQSFLDIWNFSYFM